MPELELQGIDVRNKLDCERIEHAMYKCLENLGENPGHYEEFIKLPCTNRSVGRYVERIGIDRICDYYGFTDEDLRLLGGQHQAEDATRH